MIRDVNEQVHAYAANHAPDDTVLVICECPDVGCSSPVTVTANDYERIRGSSTSFIVKAGHAPPERALVVEESVEFTVVETIGAGAEIAARLDPRRRA